MARDSRENEGNLAELRLSGFVHHLVVVDFNLSGDAGVGRTSEEGVLEEDTWPWREKKRELGI